MKDSSIGDYAMAQILGSRDIERDFIDNNLYCVSGFRFDEIIIPALKSITLRSHYNKNLLNFVSEIIEKYQFPLNIKKIKKWSDQEFQLFSKVTHRHFWNYRLYLYHSGWLIVNPKKVKEKEKINWGFSYEPINEYLNSLPQALANKANQAIKQADYHQVYSLIHSAESIYDILDFKDDIFSEGTLLNKLFNIKDEAGGTGRGEALVPFFVKSKAIGNADKFDNLSHNGFRGEIKAPGQNASYRFGTKASVGNYKFYANILRARSVLRHVVDQLGPEFQYVVSPKFYSLSMQFLREGNYREERALSTALDSAELNQDRLTAISLWFFMAHIETCKYDKSYTISQNVFSKKYDAEGDIDPLKIINALQSLDYVQDPLKFSSDIDKEIHECFKGLDYIIIFREKENKITICESADELMIDSVSQNGIKVVEKNLRNREDYPKQAFLIWQMNKFLNYYDTYCDLRAKKINNKNILCSPLIHTERELILN